MTAEERLRLAVRAYLAKQAVGCGIQGCKKAATKRSIHHHWCDQHALNTAVDIWGAAELRAVLQLLEEPNDTSIDRATEILFPLLGEVAEPEHIIKGHFKQLPEYYINLCKKVHEATLILLGDQTDIG